MSGTQMIQSRDLDLIYFVSTVTEWRLTFSDPPWQSVGSENRQWGPVTVYRLVQTLGTCGRVYKYIKTLEISRHRTYILYRHDRPNPGRKTRLRTRFLYSPVSCTVTDMSIENYTSINNRTVQKQFFVDIREVFKKISVTVRGCSESQGTQGVKSVILHGLQPPGDPRSVIHRQRFGVFQIPSPK
jgi:hypothetical protein